MEYISNENPDSVFSSLLSVMVQTWQPKSRRWSYSVCSSSTSPGTLSRRVWSLSCKRCFSFSLLKHLMFMFWEYLNAQCCIYLFTVWRKHKAQTHWQWRWISNLSECCRYCAGTMPWGHPSEHQDFEPQRHDDGCIEVIGFTMTSLVSSRLYSARPLQTASDYTQTTWNHIRPCQTTWNYT